MERFASTSATDGAVGTGVALSITFGLMTRAAVVDELARILEVVGPFGERAVVIGSAAAMLHTASSKEPCDIDFLVDVIDLMPIRSCLEADGYRPLEITTERDIDRVALVKHGRMPVDLYTKVSGQRQYSEIFKDSSVLDHPSGSGIRLASFDDLESMNRAAGRIV